jgi:glutathione S-transferase
MGFPVNCSEVHTVTAAPAALAPRRSLLLLLLQPAAQFAVHELSFQELFTSKPQWLLNLNPAGLVPLIAWKDEGQNSSISSSSSSWDTRAAVAAAAAAGHGAVMVRESLVCNEYLEEAFPDPPVSVVCHRLLPEFAVAADGAFCNHVDGGHAQSAKDGKLHSSWAARGGEYSIAAADNLMRRLCMA